MGRDTGSKTLALDNLAKIFPSNQNSKETEAAEAIAKVENPAPEIINTKPVNNEIKNEETTLAIADKKKAKKIVANKEDSGPVIVKKNKGNSIENKSEQPAQGTKPVGIAEPAPEKNEPQIAKTANGTRNKKVRD
jgi:hypothetical protein